MRPIISPADHAFASGPVFPRPRDMDEARQMVYASTMLKTERDAEAIYAVWEQFSISADISPGVRLGLKARVWNDGLPSNIAIGENAVIRGCIRADKGANIRIGAFSYIGDDVIISAHKAVSIGHGTLIAHCVNIFDNNSHSTNPYIREAEFKRMLGFSAPKYAHDVEADPISIGNRCWIGLCSTILNGVNIGDNSIVAAASTVVRDVPANVAVAGNPARLIRNLTDQETSIPAEELTT